jgi:hypothetical protein
LFATPLGAQEGLERLRLLTTEPEDDYGPAVGIVGRDAWMVFVSERDGHPNLYAIRLDEALREAPRALTPDPAADHSPELSPDGRWLAWVSEREDALGDVWVMRFPDGAPRQVSKRGDRDSHPAWSADASGRLLLTYEVRQVDGSMRVETLDAANWRGVPAATPPPATPEPPLGFPAAGRGSGGTAATGAPVYVLPVHADDTDGDGRLGPGDDPSVWLYDPATRAWRQMTPPLSGLNAPRMMQGRLLFSARPGTNLEIVEVSDAFDVAEVTGAADGLERSRAAIRNRPLEPFSAIATARQGYLMESASEAGQRSLMFAIDTLREAARPESALELIEAAERRAAFVPSMNRRGCVSPGAP